MGEILNTSVAFVKTNSADAETKKPLCLKANTSPASKRSHWERSAGAPCPWSSSTILQADVKLDPFVIAAAHGLSSAKARIAITLTGGIAQDHRDARQIFSHHRSDADEA